MAIDAILDSLYEQAKMFYIASIGDFVDYMESSEQIELGNYHNSEKNARALLNHADEFTADFFCECIQNLYSETCMTKLTVDGDY